VGQGPGVPSRSSRMSSSLDKLSVLSVFHIEADVAWGETLKRAVNSTPAFTYMGRSRTGERGLSFVRENAPDVVFLGLSLADQEGFDLVDKLYKERHKARLVLLTRRCDDFTLYHSGVRNISGFIWKLPTALTQIPACLIAQRERRLYFPPDVVEARRRLLNSPFAFFKILSDREQKLLQFFGKGMDDATIATLTNLTPATIKWHRHRILHRIGLRSTTDLVLWAHKTGIVQPIMPAPPCVAFDELLK
jgi:DNA-binding NarL/FixJ family response regulator